MSLYLYLVLSHGGCREWKIHSPESRLQRSPEVGQVRNYISQNAKGSRQLLGITTQARQETDSWQTHLGSGRRDTCLNVEKVLVSEFWNRLC